MKSKKFSLPLNSNNLSNHRPKSSIRQKKFEKNYTSNFTTDYYPLLTLGIPKVKNKNNLGNYVSKEELYDENLKLKERLLKLKRESDEIKAKLFKKGLEITKKDKLIRECSKQNVNDNESNLEKLKESTLLTLYKKKIDDIQKNYQKLYEENNILKANIRITSIKEYEIEVNIYKNEMLKLKNLYQNSKMNLEKKAEKLEEIKIQLVNQHSLITSLNKKNKELLNEISS